MRPEHDIWKKNRSLSPWPHIHKFHLGNPWLGVEPSVESLSLLFISKLQNFLEYMS